MRDSKDGIATFSEQLAEVAKPIFEEAAQSEEIKQDIIENLDAFILTRTDNPRSQMIFREIKRLLLSDDFSAVKENRGEKRMKRKSKDLVKNETVETVFPTDTGELKRLLGGSETGLSCVATDGLEPFGISKGDYIIYQKEANQNEMREKALLVFDVYGRERFLVGFAYDCFGEIGIFDGTKTTRHNRVDVRLVGYIAGSIKPFKNAVAEPSPEQVETAAPEEITVVCSHCGTTLSGTPQFLKGMGWKLKGNPLCLSCDLF